MRNNALSTLSQSIEKLQHFEINFDRKNPHKIVIFGNFKMSPCCHGNRKFKPEYVVTKAMAQSTFVPSLISIEAVFIVLQQFELVTGDFSMKTAIFHKMLMK
jgi:hypothetical protein